MGELSAIRSTIGIVRYGATAVEVIYPTLANPSAPQSSASWAFGAWVQVVSSGTLTAHSLTTIYGGLNAVNYGQLEIGEGAAGSETVIYRTADIFFTQAGTHKVHVLPWSRQITSGFRVAARVAANSSETTYQLYLGFLPRPF